MCHHFWMEEERTADLCERKYGGMVPTGGRQRQKTEETERKLKDEG